MNIWQVSIPGYTHTQAFDTVTLCLRESIRELGFESEIVYSAQKAIVLGAHLIESLPEGCIIYNLEQIPFEIPVSGHYIDMLRKHRVWDYSKRNVERLKDAGVDCVHMPIGYHPILTKDLPFANQDINCLFYGSLNYRRNLIISTVSANTVFDVYGSDLDAYIARAKITLNCHYYETKLFEIVRCSYLMANKKFILSEPGLDLELEEPFRKGIAFHEASDWPDAVSYYLQRPDIMEDIANQGFEIFSKMKQTEYLNDESKSWQR